MKIALGAVVLLLALAAPAAANAESTGPYSSFQFASFGSIGEGFGAEQFERAEDAAVAGDGVYVAMDGAIGGVRGIWRRDLTSEEVARVAPAPAILPSISEDGQFVSFTTSAPLIPSEDHNGGPDVYVRDMSKPFAESCTAQTVEEHECPYALVSTPSKKAEALTYENASPGRGALAAGRTAMSADGRYVAFVTTAESNLDGPHTPALQVAVHDMQSEATELVSAEIDPKTGLPVTVESGTGPQDVPVPVQEESGGTYGAAFPGGASTPTFPEAANATLGASISADGSTVAWLGQDLDEQSRVLEEEPFAPRAAEPLWRRLRDPNAPIRRVTGGSDPESAACEASGEKSLQTFVSLEDPCQGPFERNPTEGIFTANQSETNGLPRLSANGMLVAFVAAGAKYLPGGNEFGGAAEGEANLYLVNMLPGLTRVQAISRITEPAGKEGLVRVDGIRDFAIAPGGGKLAFVTRRGVFPLPGLSVLTPQLSVAGENELYVVDLNAHTLARVTHGFGGEEEPTAQEHGETISGNDPYTEGQGAFSPSFSANGQVLAFTSTADNIVYGDGNSAADAFVALQSAFTPNPPEQKIGASPPNPSPATPWDLFAEARALGAGAEVDAVTPGEGQISARLETRLLQGRRVRSAVLAQAADDSAAGGIHELHLAIPAALLRLVSSKGQQATVTVHFSAPGRPTLVASSEITIRGHGRAAGRRRRARRQTRRHGR